MKKMILIAASLVVISGLGFGYYMYNKPHEDINKKIADFEVTASQLFNAFESDEINANATYLDKVVQVKGTVQSASTNDEGITSITLETDDLMFGVICQLDQFSEHANKDFKEGKEVHFKGLCTGKLMDVVLVRCVEVKP